MGLAYLIILFIALLTGAFYMGFYYTDGLLASDVQELEKAENEQTQITEQAVAGPEKRDVLSVLIIGSDQREGERGGRADTSILALFDKKDKQVYIISIPRDTRADIPGRGVEKINHAYAYGGGKLMKEAVEQLIDIQLDGYISTNFDGFANMVDIIGGIEMEVEQRMYYPDEDIDLFPGFQELKGNDALAYVRYRSDGKGDIGRMERQQKFFRVLAEQLLSVSNVLKAPSLVKELTNNVNTDISATDMVSIANLLRTVSLDNMETLTLPGEAVWIDQLSYWKLDQVETKEILDPILYVQK